MKIRSTNHFYNDVEKMLSFINSSKEEFLQSYSCLTEEEYDATLRMCELRGGVKNYRVTCDILRKLEAENELRFRLAIQQLYIVGARSLISEYYEQQCQNPLNKAQETVLDTAVKLTRVNWMYLIMYISENITWDVADAKIPYARLEQITQDLCEHITIGSDIAYEDLLHCNMDDDEIIKLGYGYLIEGSLDVKTIVKLKDDTYKTLYFYTDVEYESEGLAEIGNYLTAQNCWKDIAKIEAISINGSTVDDDIQSKDYISVNVQFLNSAEREDETQLDLHCETVKERMAEFIKLIVSLRDEMDIDAIIGVEEGEED